MSPLAYFGCSKSLTVEFTIWSRMLIERGLVNNKLGILKLRTKKGFQDLEWWARVCQLFSTVGANFSMGWFCLKPQDKGHAGQGSSHQKTAWQPIRFQGQFLHLKLEHSLNENIIWQGNIWNNLHEVDHAVLCIMHIV